MSNKKYTVTIVEQIQITSKQIKKLNVRNKTLNSR